MRNVVEIISGIGFLILVYLVVSNGAQTAAVINSIGTNAVSGIKVLQGRG